MRDSHRVIEAALERDGFAVLRGLVTSERVAEFVARTESALADGAGTRRMLELSWCADLARELADADSLRNVLPPDAHPVQCTFFVKSADANWLVSLHQDLSIPVAERVDGSRVGGWSEKEGQLFVQPPPGVLAEMLAVRVHRDACDQGNGALRVVPGSHRLGRLSAEEAYRARAESGEVLVHAAAGDAMLMRPLLLHASSKSISDRPRRILHFVFGPPKLPEGLRWPARKPARLNG